MRWLESLVVGLVQGVTEILPVSSDGHLAVLEYLWNIPEHIRVNLTAALHLGTAVALIVFFAPKLSDIIRGLFAIEPAQRSQSQQLVFMVLVSSLPAVIVGLLFGKFVENIFTSSKAIGWFFCLNGLLLLATRFAPNRDKSINWGEALLIGTIQATALLPAISRSGTTIGLALLLGIRRYEAFEFSFLLAIPITVGAAVFELLHFDFSVIALGPVILGIITAGVAGFFMILLLRRLVLSRWFFLFGIYCWFVGLAVLLFLR